MYKPQQVLRTAVPLTTTDGVSVPAETRVVVMNTSKLDGTTRVKVADSTQPTLAKTYLAVNENDLVTTKRGRPRK